MKRVQKEIRLGVDKRLLYVDHPSAKCLEIDIEIFTKRGWVVRTSFSLSYENLQKLVKETER